MVIALEEQVLVGMLQHDLGKIDVIDAVGHLRFNAVENIGLAGKLGLHIGIGDGDGGQGCRHHGDPGVREQLGIVVKQRTVRRHEAVAGIPGLGVHSSIVKEQALRQEYRGIIHIGFLGSLDGDGAVNASDLAILKKVIAGLTSLDDKEVVNPDVDGDGTATPNAADLAVLKKKIAGLV